jgi:hypothetical protein
MRSHESGPMTVAGELAAPMGLLSGAPPIPGNRRPTDGESLPEPVVVPTLGADTTGEAGEPDDSGEPKRAKGTVAEVDPTAGPVTAGPTPVL